VLHCTLDGHRSTLTLSKSTIFPLVLQLLERDPAKRLGSGPGDAKEITSHPFFDGIDWEKLYNRGYTPPFNPNVNGQLDLSNFDPQFTNDPIPQSLIGESNFKVDVEIDDEFIGFSYTAADGFDVDEKDG